MIGENDVFIITGSLYFISEVRKYIREKLDSLCYLVFVLQISQKHTYKINI